jgi:photosynthetic reaction center cytochrome c subunit
MVRSIRLLLFFTLAWPLAAVAQENRPLPPNENVKVLTELQGQPLRAEMKRIAAALGVDCDHCHVQGNFASDEKLPKRVGRRMIEMTKSINAQSFPKYEVKEGESVLGRVTCMTCHQGATTPK